MHLHVPLSNFFLVCYVILQWFFKQTTREHETEDKLTHRASSAVKIWCEQTDLGKAPDRQWSTAALQAGGRQGQAPQWEWSIRQGSHGTVMKYMYNDISLISLLSIYRLEVSKKLIKVKFYDIWF